MRPLLAVTTRERDIKLETNKSLESKDGVVDVSRDLILSRNPHHTVARRESHTAHPIEKQLLILIN